jgi:hypothetical protein
MSAKSVFALMAGWLFVAAASDAAPVLGPIPNLSPDGGTGWVPDRLAGDDLLPPESGPGPVMSVKDHPYVPNNVGQSTYRVADLSNPILKPWAIEQMKKVNDDVLAGKIPFTARERCWPGGVPLYDIYERDRPIFFVQTPAKITIVSEHDSQIRHIYMNVPHSKNLKPSWYGESVGHYEGDTLVVDTIGMNDRSFVDNYRTPHTTALHVVERFHLVEGGKKLQADITVEDPGAFNMKWSAIQRWSRREDRPMIELVCAEQPVDYFKLGLVPIPSAAKPDF